MVAMSRDELDELSSIRAELLKTRGKLAKLRYETAEYDQLFIYRLRLHKRRAKIMYRHLLNGDYQRHQNQNYKDIFFNPKTED